MNEKDLIGGKNHPWEVVIGLEIHAQIVSKTKLFSAAAATFGDDPNTHVSFVDAGFPGMLPTLNEFCVEQAIRTGLGLNAQINKYSVFDRKHYFYGDLPSGYQITQFYHPIVGRGHLFIERADGVTKTIGIHHIHLEQDAGKSVHDLHATSSCLDFNRAGVALMEIVTEPDLRSAEEVSLFIKKLRSTLRYLGTCDGNMEEGGLRADVNISVRAPGETLGNRVEVKNVNSIRFMQEAILFEARRQIDLLEAGNLVYQETRLFDPRASCTLSMRDKENARDYLYFPDPDLLPLVVSQEYIETIRQTLPELPDAKKERFISELGLSSYDASILVAEKEIAFFFEEAVAASATSSPMAVKLIANWIMGDFFAALNNFSCPIEKAPVTPRYLASLVDHIISGTISHKMAKEVFLEMWHAGRSPDEIIEEKNLSQVTDSRVIESVVQSSIEANFDKVEQYLGGREKLFGFFVGDVMKRTSGKGHPQIVNDVLRRLLEERRSDKK